MPCPTPEIVPWVSRRHLQPPRSCEVPPVWEHQPCRDQTKCSSRAASRTRVPGLLPGPVLAVPGDALGLLFSCREVGLVAHLGAWTVVCVCIGLGLVIISNYYYFQSQRCGAGGWVDGHRGQSHCCSIDPQHSPAELEGSILQIWGEKGPTPFPTCRITRSKLQAWPEGAADRAEIAEASNRSLARAPFWDVRRFPGHDISPPSPNPGRAPSPALGALGRAGRGSRAGTAVWLSEILDR